jgi:peptidoglycan/LPS O-acetylase OafA/YrhL
VLISQGGLADLAHQQRLIVVERAGWIGLLALLLIGHGIDGGDGNPPWMMALVITAASLAFVGIVFRVHFSRLPPAADRILNHAGLVWMGKYSYGIYLIHVVLLSQVRHFLEPRLPSVIAGDDNLKILVTGLIVTALSLIWAWLMFRLVESPALRWGARFSVRTPVGVIPPALRF